MFVPDNWFEEIKEALIAGRDLVSADLETLLQLARQPDAPFSPVMVRIVDNYGLAVSIIKKGLETLNTLEAGLICAENDMRDQQLEMTKQMNISIRRQKVWRMLCMKMALGEGDRQEMLLTAFREVLGDPPLEVDLDCEMARLVGKLEALENDSGEFGELRSIVLDGGLQPPAEENHAEDH